MSRIGLAAVRSAAPQRVRPAHSIAARMSLVFLFLLLLIVLLGAFSVGSLTYFSRTAAQVQERWLPSTRALGDLNNFTSDFRAAEAATLLAADTGERAAREREMRSLDPQIRMARAEYAQIPHDAAESALYARFGLQWTRYRAIVGRGDDASGQRDAASRFNSESRAAYDAASDTLGSLTERNVTSAREATLRAEVAYRWARGLILMTMAAAACAVALATIYVRRSVAAPLRVMSQRMRRLARNETDIELDGTERGDEIGEMARAVVIFRDNAVELMSGRRGLEQQAMMLQEKLTEERRLTGLQRNFVSMASHELRTPLTLIDSHAQRLVRLRDSLSAEQLAERAGRIRSAVVRITHFIDQLIDSSRVLDGEVDLYFHPGSMDVGELLRDVCALQREIAPWVRIEEDFEVGALRIDGDPKLLFQVFNNLLANAIKYSPRSASVKVSARASPSGVTALVEDGGIGIPPQDQTRVFERYFRASNVGGISGTGVGLYFASTVVELHAGTIHLTSEEGHGTRFYVELPHKRAAEPAPAGGAEPAT